MANADIVSAIISFGSCDIACANKVIDEAGLNDEDVADFIKQSAVDCGMNIFDLDIVACVYEYVLQNVRTLIEEKTQIDILNTEGYEIYVAGNYLATSYDSSTVNSERVQKLIKDNFDLTKSEVESDFSGVSQLKWFLNQIDF